MPDNHELHDPNAKLRKTITRLEDRVIKLERQYHNDYSALRIIPELIGRINTLEMKLEKLEIEYAKKHGIGLL